MVTSLHLLLGFFGNCIGFLLSSWDDEEEEEAKAKRGWHCNLPGGILQKNMSGNSTAHHAEEDEGCKLGENPQKEGTGNLQATNNILEVH
eukprot:m.67699 g.67699  ORF g.67699 m.67699 type:complete len:90 (+) comp8224_c1_seq2:43-312(+)